MTLLLYKRWQLALLHDYIILRVICSNLIVYETMRSETEHNQKLGFYEKPTGNRTNPGIAEL